MTDTALSGAGIDFAIVDSTADRLDDGPFVWFATGAAQPLRSRSGMTDPLGHGRQLARADRDASFALIDCTDPRLPVMHLWRGLFSTHDWYFAERSDGRLIVADDFRSVVAALPVAERSVGEGAIVQHYLFRSVQGTDTYLERMRRVGVGEHVSIDIGRGTRTAELIDRIPSETDLVAPDQYKKVIEDALESYMVAFRGRSDVHLAFSGGVDSSLLATFLAPDSRLHTVVPDTPEFDVETSYARESARFLKRPIEEFRVSEDSYVEQLEAVIDDSGRPPVDDVVPYLAAPYRDNSGDTYVIGEGADAIFAVGGRAAKVANLVRQRHLNTALVALTGAAPTDVRDRARMILARSARLSAEPRGIEGYGAGSMMYGDSAFITEIVGPQPIEDALLADLDYMLARVDLADPKSRFFQHLELRQWRHAFGDHTRVDVDAGRAHGAAVFAPYLASSTISALTRIPVDARYIKGFTGKWVLKEILADRLPGYPIGQRKRHTELPFMRYCNDGPLVGIWDRYATPDLFEGKVRTDLIGNDLPAPVLWNAITHAIWDERIARNPRVTAHPSAEAFSIDLDSTNA